MEDIKAHQLLRNQEEEPTNELFKNMLDEPVYNIMNTMEQNIVAAGLALEWRYYKDGKAWLGKVTYKKKTIVWLSVWNEFIKASFYFTEKVRPDVLNLDFNDNIRSSFAVTQPTGKLIPLIISVKDVESLKYFNIILNHKKNIS